jgi:hypothetical protein
MEADVFLWGTGYSVDLDYLGPESLAKARGLNDIISRCYSVFLSADAPKLFLLAPSVLETITSTPGPMHMSRSLSCPILPADQSS